MVMVLMYSDREVVSVLFNIGEAFGISSDGTLGLLPVHEKKTTRILFLTWLFPRHFRGSSGHC